MAICFYLKKKNWTGVVEARPFTFTWKYLIARVANYKPLFFLNGAELRQKVTYYFSY